MAEAIETGGEYLVNIGTDRFVSSYINQGKLVERNQVVQVGPTMAARLLVQKYKDPRTNQMVPYWREATEEEAQAYIHRLENLDPNEADPSLFAEAARAEAMDLGHVEPGEKKAVERQQDEEEELQPKRRRNRKKDSE